MFLLHYGIISAKLMKLNHITSRQTHTNQHRSHLSHKSRKVSLACGFLAHFQKDNIHIMEKVSETLFYISFEIFFTGYSGIWYIFLLLSK